MRDHAVIVVGGGPTGLTLAGELALAGDIGKAIAHRGQDRLGIGVRMAMHRL